MNKKAQGISMNVIIIAAIALLVLVVLSVIFIGNMSKWQVNIDCPQKGGICREGSCINNEIQATDGTCKTGQTCCKTSFETTTP